MVTAVNAAERSAASSSAAGDTTYVVERGDTLSQIAREHGVTLQALRAANPRVADPDRIYVGDRLTIPAAATTGGVTDAPAPAGGANQLSGQGLELIKGFEGLRLSAYQDAGGAWTIGYGHTGGVQPGDRISGSQAEAYLRQDTAWAQQAVRDLVKVPLSQGQFDALTSFTFNLGRGALEKSTLLKKLNAGDHAGAQAEFAKWVHADGRVLQGLVRRRAAEADLFGGQAPAGGTSPSPPAAAPQDGYTVKRGDTMWDIARRHGVSLPALIAANPQIADPDLIRPGQQIHLPGADRANADWALRNGLENV